MFIQSAVWKLRLASAGLLQRTAFLIIFFSVVVGPLVVFAIGGRGPDTIGQPGLAWSFLVIALLLLTGTGIALSMFRRKEHSLSIRSK